MVRIRAHSIWQDNRSPGTKDPWIKLAAHVLVNAVSDLQTMDILTSVDALLFWLDPEGGARWLDCLGLELTRQVVFERAVFGGTGNEEETFIKLVAG